jgi:hypothetical protein
MVDREPDPGAKYRSTIITRDSFDTFLVDADCGTNLRLGPIIPLTVFFGVDSHTRLPLVNAEARQQIRVGN